MREDDCAFYVDGHDNEDSDDNYDSVRIMMKIMLILMFVVMTWPPSPTPLYSQFYSLEIVAPHQVIKAAKY